MCIKEEEAWGINTSSGLSPKVTSERRVVVFFVWRHILAHFNARCLACFSYNTFTGLLFLQYARVLFSRDQGDTDTRIVYWYWYCIFWTLSSLPRKAIVSPKTDSLLLQSAYTFCIKSFGLVHFKIRSNNWCNLAPQLHSITQTSILKSRSFTCHLQLKASAFGFQRQSASFLLWQSC